MDIVDKDQELEATLEGAIYWRRLERTGPRDKARTVRRTTFPSETGIKEKRMVLLARGFEIWCRRGCVHLTSSENT